MGPERPLTQFQADISSYAEQTVVIEFEFEVQDDCFATGFDNIRITQTPN